MELRLSSSERRSLERIVARPDDVKQLKRAQGLLAVAGGEAVHLGQVDEEVVGEFGVGAAFRSDAVGDRLDELGRGGVVGHGCDHAEIVAGFGQTRLRWDYTYNADAEVTEIKRYSDTNGTNLVATTEYGYDGAGRTTAITNKNASGTKIDDFNYTCDAAGTLQDHIDYTPFGQIATETNPTFGDRYKYTSREWDAEIELQYNRARYYDSATGR